MNPRYLCVLRTTIAKTLFVLACPSNSVAQPAAQPPAPTPAQETKSPPSTAPATTPATDSAPAPATLSPQAAIGFIYSTYRTGPVAERVRVRISSPQGTQLGSGLVIRTRPADGSMPPEALIEAGSLIIHARAATVTVIHRAYPLTYWQGELSAEGQPGLHAFSDLIGPLPLPQLALVFGKRAELLEAPVPQARGITWSAVRAFTPPPPPPPPPQPPEPAAVPAPEPAPELTPEAGKPSPVNPADNAENSEPPLTPPSTPPNTSSDATNNAPLQAPPAPRPQLIITGQSSLGLCELTIDAESGRLIALQLPLSNRPDTLSLQFADEPDPPTSTPASTPALAPTVANPALSSTLSSFWTIDLKGRTRVAGLANLADRVAPNPPARPDASPDAPRL